jgi:uncharacterized membrane protein
MAPAIVAFVSDRAGEASRALQAVKQHRKLTPRNAGVLVRDENSQILVFDTVNTDTRYGAFLGAIVGQLIGSPIGVSPGSVGVQASSTGAPVAALMALGDDLQPGGSALIVLLDSGHVDAAIGLLATFRGRTWQAMQLDDLTRQPAHWDCWKEGGE